MSELQIFENAEFGKVRTLTIDNEPYFVGKDVAEVLGYAKARNAIAAHVDEEDKKDAPIQGTLGGMQEMTVINESGLYSLILGSKLPSAKRFKRWVTSEVLPSIRKTGQYTIPDNVKYLIPKTFSQALQLAANLQAKIEADADKVAYAEAVTKGDDDKSIGDIAKVIEQEYHVKLGRNRFFEILRNDGLLIKDGKSRNIPTQRAIEAGWFRIAGRTINKPNGDTMETYTVYVTGKGRVYLAGKYGKKLAEEQGKQVTA